AWAARYWLERDCQYVATDILVDEKIGLGRGAFYGEFGRVQADGEHLPFADATFDVVYCVATLHHALDLGQMVREMARVARPGAVVAGLNE
ncbi:MAG: class I SAM-dependent methyltransferase, partial [Gaiellaceae bacterium]